MQEELGYYGARTAAFSLDPDVAIAIDVTYATDVPGGDPKTAGKIELGSGAAIGRGPILNTGVSDLLAAAAEAEGIAHTFEVLTNRTHTDADAVHVSRAGVPTGLVSVPLRYMHSPVELASLDDLEAVIALVVAFANRLTRETRASSGSARRMAGRSVIVSAVRTPFGRLGGGLAAYPATELGSIAIRAALDRAGIEAHEPDYVIMGQVLQGGAGQAPARQAAIGAGLPLETPSDTINKVCASSIRAVEIADSMIRAGDAELVVTGGMESMSNAPYALEQARFGYRLGDGSLIDLVTRDGLVSTFDGRHMVEQASFVARELGISREEQDAWALRSHRRAVAAIDAGLLGAELVAVGELDADESPRRDTSPEKLASLRPVFDPDGTTTAGNAPGVNDGAACVVVASEEWARRRAIEPLATILAQGYVAGEVAFLARTPALAAAVALGRAGKTIGEVARIEINEAFASVAHHSTELLGADEERVNVNGGAVALGHPIGASGGRIVATMVHELRRTGGGLGLAAICSGGGQGDALLIEV